MKVIFICLLFLFPWVNIFSQQKEYLEKKRKETLKEIENTQLILNEVNRSKSTSVEKLKLLDKQINSRNALLNSLSNEIENQDKEISEQQILIFKIENDIKDIKTLYAKLIFSAYKKHRKGNFISYIFSAKNFSQAYKRLMYIKQYSYFRKKQLETINDIKVQLAYKKQQLESSKEIKENLLVTKEKEIEKLGFEKNVQKSEYNNLLKKEDKLKKDLAENIKIAKKLQKEVEDLIKAEIAKKKVDIPKIREENRVITGNFKDNRGHLPWPVEKGLIINPFGEQKHPVLKGVIIQNNGIDFSTYSNAKVYALFEGEVKRVFSFLGANYTVIIGHGEFLTLYQNLGHVVVKPGDKVKARQELGTLFAEPGSKTSVLHLEIWEEYNKLNPEVWLSKN